MCLAWVYGGSRLMANMENMNGVRRPLRIYKFIWTFISPTVLIFAIVFSLVQVSRPPPAPYRRRRSGGGVEL